MKRNSIKCSHCGSNDFEININIIPRGINLVCNECGHVTDIAFFDEENNAYAVDSPKAQELYNETHCRKLTRREVVDALYPSPCTPDHDNEGGNK